MGVTDADARFMKALDVDLTRRLAGEHDAILTLEENAVGGFGPRVLHFMVLDGLMDDVSLLLLLLLLLLLILLLLLHVCLLLAAYQCSVSVASES